MKWISTNFEIISHFSLLKPFFHDEWSFTNPDQSHVTFGHLSSLTSKVLWTCLGWDTWLPKALGDQSRLHFQCFILCDNQWDHSTYFVYYIFKAGNLDPKTHILANVNLFPSILTLRFMKTSDNSSLLLDLRKYFGVVLTGSYDDWTVIINFPLTKPGLVCM